MQNLLRSTLLALVAALALALSACGSDEESSEDIGDLGPDPAAVAPADALFYGEAVVRPEGVILDDFNAAFSTLLGTEDPSAMITEALDEELASDPEAAGITYSEDIAPWLGIRAGGFVTGYDPKTEEADGAIAFAITDAEAAQAFIEKARAAEEEPTTDAEYNGVSYTLDAEESSAVGIDGDFLIAGTEQGFKDAVDAGAGQSFADSENGTFSDEETPDNSLFSGYVDGASLVDLIESSGDIPAAQLDTIRQQLASYGQGPINFWGTVEEDTMTLAGSAPAQEGAAPSELLSDLPADSWLAFATGDVGEQLQTFVDQFSAGFQAGIESSAAPGLDVDPIAEIEREIGIDLEADLAWIGDVGGFVQGTSVLGLGGGLVIETDDEGAATATLDKAAKALQGNADLQVTPTESGFSLQPSGAPVGAEVAVQDGKVVFAAGGATVDDVLSPGETLDSSDRFEAASGALGDDLTPTFFLDFAPVVSLIESTGAATSDPSYQQAKPYLDRLDYLIGGSGVDGDRASVSVTLGVKEAEASSEETAAVITP